MAVDVELGIDGYGPGTQIGSGGGATVYRANDRYDRARAVKIFRSTLATSEAAREQQARRRLGSHAHIVDVIDQGSTRDGWPYVVMPLFGNSAQSWVDGDPTNWRQVVRVGVQISGALCHARDLKVFHRDIKPANVLLGTNNHAVLSDFGIARIASETLSGDPTAYIPGFTAAYAAPERMERNTATERSEIYSLAATLAALLIGEEPLGQAPELGHLDIPKSLARLLISGMAPNPGDRPRSLEAFRGHLQAISVDPDQPIKLPWRKAQRRWLMTLSALAACSAIIGFLAITNQPPFGPDDEVASPTSVPPAAVPPTAVPATTAPEDVVATIESRTPTAVPIPTSTPIPAPTCPIGSEPAQTGSCSRQYPADEEPGDSRPNCLTGDLVDSQCVIAGPIPATVCPNGSLADGRFCFRPVASALGGCPEGTTLYNGSCVISLPAEFVSFECDPGFDLVDFQCYRYEEPDTVLGESTYQCPPSSFSSPTADDQTCVETFSVNSPPVFLSSDEILGTTPCAAPGGAYQVDASLESDPLNVRLGPSIDQTIFGQLQAGTRGLRFDQCVVPEASSTPWWRITNSGWVSSAFVEQE